MKHPKKIAIVVAIIFFVAGLLTLSDYGINWDTVNHLPRGQAYLNYFLTGNKDFSNRPPYFAGWPGPEGDGGWYWQNPDNLLFDPDRPKSEITSRSMYESPWAPMTYFLNNDSGHPPLSDIMSSIFNRVLFGKLRLVNDVDSYRVYGVLLAAVLVGLIFYWVGEIYGGFAGFIAALSLALYPLFWSESHFNTEKDIPETVYWSFFLFSIWKSVRKKSWKWMLVSGIFFGLALGTKFNILFVGFVILPWLLIKTPRIIIQKWFVVSSFLAMLIGLTILVSSWPYLWADPVAKLLEVLNFYKTIGTTTATDPRFLGPLGINTYPIQWILFTTPIIILALSFLGIVFTKKDRTYFLFLFWLAVPIGRVVWPGTSIYGGVRQLMEYIPALAIFAGVGAKKLLVVCPKHLRLMLMDVILLPFVLLVLNLYKIHPNENVYFNQLIGGLAGAKEEGIPYAGFSFGAPYRQVASWLNQNASPGALVTFAYELIPNIPRIFLRRDLNLHDNNNSGYLRKGEYVITLAYEGTDKRSYIDMYLDRFIEPVYQVKVDGVSILKIWKNDSEHLKLSTREAVATTAIEKTDSGLKFDLGEVKSLSRLELTYSGSDCEQLNYGYTQISQDGEQWERLPGVFPEQKRIPALGTQPAGGKFIDPFVGQEARFIEIVTNPVRSCLGKVKDFKVYYFVDL